MPTDSKMMKGAKSMTTIEERVAEFQNRRGGGDISSSNVKKVGDHPDREIDHI